MIWLKSSLYINFGHISNACHVGYTGSMISYGDTCVSDTMSTIYALHMHCFSMISFGWYISIDIYNSECIFRVCGLGCAKVLAGKMLPPLKCQSLSTELLLIKCNCCHMNFSQFLLFVLNQNLCEHIVFWNLNSYIKFLDKVKHDQIRKLKMETNGLTHVQWFNCVSSFCLVTQGQKIAQWINLLWG